MTAITNFEDWLPELDLNKLDYPVLVAGGALRDSWFGKDVTDVDVFIGVSKRLLEDCWKRKKFAISKASRYIIADNYTTVTPRPPSFPTTSPRGFLNFEVDSEGDYDAGDFVSGRCHDKPGLNVILIACDAFPHEEQFMADMLFDKFPCSISRIAWSPKTDKWYIHDSFTASEKTRTIYFDKSISINSKYYKKIYPKYYGWHCDWEEWFI